VARQLEAEQHRDAAGAILRRHDLPGLHGRKAALRRIVATLALLALAGPAPAEGDAAIKAQEGSVEHWIEYYRQQRESRPPTQPTSEMRVEEAKAHDPKAVANEAEFGKNPVNPK
jgi:hypothetical protein